MLTTSQAWAKIAEAYERKIATGKIAPDGDETATCGLCSALGELEIGGFITEAQDFQMHAQIDEALEDARTSDLPPAEGDSTYPFLFEYGAAGDQLRAILATLFSESSK